MNASGKYGATTQLAWINFVASCGCFVQLIEFGQTPFGAIKLEYFFTYPLLFALILKLRGLYLDFRFVVCMLILGVTAYWNITEGKDTTILMGKNLVGMFQNGALYYMVLKANDFKVMPLFRAYLKLAVGVAFFGIVQEVAFLLKIRFIYDLGWLLPHYLPGTATGLFMRTHSILPEPASMDFSLCLAAFASIHSWLDPKHRLVTRRQSFIIMGAYLLSFSTVGYLGLIIAVIVLLLNFRKFAYIAAAFVLVPALVLVAYNSVKDVRIRIDNTLELVSGEADLEMTDLSNLALFANMHVALSSFRDNPWIGSGLGSHAVSYDRYIGSVIDLEMLGNTNKVVLNKEDASSMLLRLLSETGILGPLFILIFMFRCRLSKRRDPTETLWIINNGIFSLMILMLLRYGNYFALGSFLFFWLLYSSKREALEILSEGVEGREPPVGLLPRSGNSPLMTPG